MARKKNTVPTPTYLTTHQVAAALGVSGPTVVKWIEGGRLAAHRTLGRHRRIAWADLVTFAVDNQYPLDTALFSSSHLPVRRVLVVDDEPDFAEMVRDYLTVRGGFEVEIAESGFQAGFTVARFKPDLILLDIMMPDMDGFEALRMLQQNPETRHVPVIACTGYRDANLARRVEEHPFTALIEKPVKLDALLGVVQRHVVGAASLRP